MRRWFRSNPGLLAVTIPTALVSGLVGGLVTGIALGDVHWHPQLGDVATWATALVAAPAVYFGIDAFRKQRADLDRLRTREAVRDELLRYQVHRVQAEQARQVKINAGLIRPHTDPDSAGSYKELSAAVLNESDEAIFALACRFEFDGTRSEPAEVRWSYDDLGRWRYGPPITQPVQALGAIKSRGILFKGRFEGTPSMSDIDVVIRFTDELGTRWERRMYGLTYRVNDAEW